MSDYPLHEKFKENKEVADNISNFLDFLENKGLSICSYSGEDYDGGYYPYPMSKENLIGTFLGISPIELEKEKQQMLEFYKKELGYSNFKQ